MLVTIFCEIDDFCKFFENEAGLKIIDNNQRAGRKRMLSTSEVLTIIIYFHQSGFKNFKVYYQTAIQGFLKEAFPQAVSYNRFIELRQESLGMLMLFVKFKGLGSCDGISIIDSSKLEVCNVRRAYSHKVFHGLAAKGKTSTGWFYGFKLHLIINRVGEIISFYVTPGNVSDNNVDVLDQLTRNVFGKLIGDRGYIGAFMHFYQKGIELIHKIRKNMKNKLMTLYNKFLLRRRGVIEVESSYKCPTIEIQAPKDSGKAIKIRYSTQG
jgi:Transposase DDE domain